MLQEPHVACRLLTPVLVVFVEDGPNLTLISKFRHLMNKGTHNVLCFLAYCMQGTEIELESLQVVLGTCKTSCLTVIHFSSHLYLFISLVVLVY
jgi:hypothetical protein